MLFGSSLEQSCSRVALACGGTQAPQEARDVTTIRRSERLLSERARAAAALGYRGPPAVPPVGVWLAGQLGLARRRLG